MVEYISTNSATVIDYAFIAVILMIWINSNNDDKLAKDDCNIVRRSVASFSGHMQDHYIVYSDTTVVCDYEHSI